MKFFIKIQILIFIIIQFACQENIKLDNIEFESEVKNIYQFAIIDSIDNEYYDVLSKFVNLDSIIGNEPDPTEIAIKLTDFTHNQWHHNGNNTPSKFQGLTILKEVRKGKEFRCVEYSILLKELLIASKIPARIVGLNTKTVETQKSGAGHVVVEYYDKILKKWIYADAQTNVVAFSNAIPLNAVELQIAIKNETEITVRNLNRKNIDKFKNWIGPYLYFFNTSFDQRIKAQNRSSYNGKTKLILTPIGSKNPTKFQITSEIKNALYTNSIGEFYPDQ